MSFQVDPELSNPSAAPQEPLPTMQPPVDFEPALVTKILLTLTVLTVVAVNALWGNQFDFHWAVMLAVSIVGALVGVLFLYAIAWTVYYVSARRSVVASRTLEVLCVLAMVGSVVRGVEQQGRLEREAALDDAYASARQAMRDQILEEGAVAPSAIEGVTNAFDTMAREGSGNEARAGRGGARLMREVLEERAHYDAALQPLIESGGFDPATLTTREAIDERIKIVQRLAAANERLARYMEGYENRMRTILLEEGLPPDEVETAVLAARSQMRLDLQRRIRESDRQLCQSGEALLRLLADHWGAWRVDGAYTMFDDARVADRFNALLDELDAASREQTAAQQAVAAHLGS